MKGQVTNSLVPGNTWPPRPDRQPVSRCTWPASWSSSTGRPVSAPAAQPRSSSSPGPCPLAQARRQGRLKIRRLSWLTPRPNIGALASRTAAPAYDTNAGRIFHLRAVDRFILGRRVLMEHGRRSPVAQGLTGPCCVVESEVGTQFPLGCPQTA